MSDSGERYHGDPFRASPQEPSKMETLIRATQQMIKEEESRLQHHVVSGRLSKAHSPCFTAAASTGLPQTSMAVAAGGVDAIAEHLLHREAGKPLGSHDNDDNTASPASVSRLSSPSSDGMPRSGLSLAKDYMQTDLSPHDPQGQGSPLIYSSPQDRHTLDRQAAYALTGYSLEHLYDQEGMRGYAGLGYGGVQYDVASHMRMQTEQMQGHKATSVIITNGS